MSLASSDADNDTAGLEADIDPTQQKSASYGLHEQHLPASDVEPSPDTVLKDGMSDKPEGLGGQAMSLNKMAESIGPIVSTFDGVLVSHSCLMDHGQILTIYCSPSHTSNTTMQRLPVPRQSWG